MTVKIIFEIIKDIKCTCDPRTSHFLCPTKRGQCMCKATNISGQNYDRCAKGFEGFPTCSMTGRDLKNHYEL